MIVSVRVRLVATLLLSLQLLAGITLSPVPLHAQQAAGAEYVANEVIVKVLGPGKSVLTKLARDYHLDKKPLDEFGSRQIYRLRILDGMAPPDKAQMLLNDARVAFAEPNYLSSIPEGGGKKGWASGGVSSEPPSNWALEKINLYTAPGTGAGLVVAVLDTGIDRTHLRLRDKLVAGYDFVDNDRSPDEKGSAKKNLGYGHGTHVAGIIAQVAPEARIMPVRVLDPDGNGNMWVLTEALQFVTDPNGDGNTSDSVDIINMSIVVHRPIKLLSEIIGASTFCTDQDANAATPDVCVQRAGIVDNNVLVVAAAGNEDDNDPATPLPVVYPAAEPGVIGVTATDRNDLKASFANYSSSYVDIAAPGVGITSLAPKNSSATWDGTSMAAPFVAGAAAVLWSAHPSMNSAEVTARLLATVTPIDAQNPAYEGQLGKGRLDFAPPQSYVPLTLTSICTIDATANLARWRVRNSNAYDVAYTWQIYGTPEAGQRTVGPNSDDYFHAIGGTMVITANGVQSVKATNPAPCV